MIIPAGFPKVEFGKEFFSSAENVVAAIELLGEKLDDFSEPLAASLELVIIPSIAKNFAAEGRPQWAPLAASTLFKRPSTPILQVTGKLFQSTQQRSNWMVGRDSISLTGIDGVKYAPFHQFGTKDMPARPYAMYQDEDVAQIVEIFEIWIDGIIDRVWSES